MLLTFAVLDELELFEENVIFGDFFSIGTPAPIVVFQFCGP
jgi:hypothetical protein